jgi:hypothetical protein
LGSILSTLGPLCCRLYLPLRLANEVIYADASAKAGSVAFACGNIA